VNFNVNFNVLLSKYIVHPLVKIKKTLIISVVIYFWCIPNDQLAETFLLASS
jgi:hypothetical protein